MPRENTSQSKQIAKATIIENKVKLSPGKFELTIQTILTTYTFYTCGCISKEVETRSVTG